MKQTHFENVAVGEEIDSLVKRPTEVQLFRFSAITWNAHRIHYDRDWARHEGYPGVLVQAGLHGAFLAQLVTDWAGPRGMVRRLSWSNRRPAFAGDTLTCRGKVVAARADTDPPEVDLELWEENQRGETLVVGAATVSLPREG